MKTKPQNNQLGYIEWLLEVFASEN